MPRKLDDKGGWNTTGTEAGAAPIYPKYSPLPIQAE
jgi:hypothetical protein